MGILMQQRGGTMKYFRLSALVILALYLLSSQGLTQSPKAGRDSSPIQAGDAKLKILPVAPVLANRGLEFRFAGAILADDGKVIEDLARRGLNVNAELPDVNRNYLVAATDLGGLVDYLGIDLKLLDQSTIRTYEFYPIRKGPFAGWYGENFTSGPYDKARFGLGPVNILHSDIFFGYVIVPYGEARFGSATMSVDKLLESYPNIPGENYRMNLQGFPSGRPLVIAMLQNRLNALDAIIGAGGKIDEGGESGITPLMIASGVGRMDAIQALLSRGANASIVDKQGQSAFHWAARGGNREALDLFLERGAAIDEGNLIGQTALMLASQYGNTDAVKTLLSHGARIGDRDNAGRTALGYAVESGVVDACAALVEAGAKIDDRDSTGMTPLMYVGRMGLPGNPMRAIAARSGGSETKKDAIGEEQIRTEEFLSVAGGRTTRLLLDRGADKNARDKMGNTALMHAAQDGRLTVLGLLMDSGADYRAKNMNGKSAKNLALDNKQREAAWMLRWWDPTRFEARLGGGFSGISHPGQAGDFEYEASVGMSVRFNKRIGLYNGIAYAAMISDNTGSDVPSIPGVQAYNSGFFKFGALEYRPEIHFDFPPLRRGHVYLLGGLSVGKVISASLNSSDGSTDSRDIKSIVNGSTYGWRVGAGLIGRGMSLEVCRSQNTTDAFKDWSGSFGAWTLTVGYWR
jgi:ankyrin repeat protein